MMECFTKLFLKSIQNAGTNSAMPDSGFSLFQILFARIGCIDYNNRHNRFL